MVKSGRTSLFLPMAVAAVVAAIVGGCVDIDNLGASGPVEVSATDEPGRPTTATSIATGTPTTPPTTAAPGKPAVTSPSSTPNIDATECEGFIALDAYERILAAIEAATPDDDRCADEVAAATASARVWEVSDALHREYLAGESSPQRGIGQVECGERRVAVPITNEFDAPVIFWGAFILADDGPDEAIAAIAPTISGVIEPGAEGELFADVSGVDEDWAVCTIGVRMLVAPVGDLASDGGLVSVENGDPQASDEVATWIPALRDAEDAVFGELPSTDEAASGLIAMVEDIHSPDLFSAIELASGFGLEPERPKDARRRNRVESTAPDDRVCAAFDVTEGRDDVGELALVVIGPNAPQSETQSVGLYRRGSDGRWRYAGRTLAVGGLEASAPTCDKVDLVDLVDP